MGMTIEEGIKQVYPGPSHVVILGAGASIASTRRNAEKFGKQLPSMDNFIGVLQLQDVVNKVPKKLQDKNFEKLYSSLHSNDPDSKILKEIENRIKDYFGSMSLPDEPTIYDYMVLSLRGKDLIATFNWDPFLYQAWVRNRKFTDDLPHLSFLHGCVAVGYSKEDKRSGPVGYQARKEGGLFVPTKLLYPVEQKNYTDDEFINIEWDRVKYWLKKESKSVRATIFGYGAPASDVEAVSLLNEAWGDPDERSMEQFEIIDVVPEDQLRERWNGFIHTHHYDVTDSYFGSSLAFNPRRTCEAFYSAYYPETPAQAFRTPNRIPQDFKTLKELWDWHEPLLQAEKADAESRIKLNQEKPDTE